MQRLYASYNSRFFAVVDPGQAVIHRGNTPLSTVVLDDAEEVIRLGDGGDLFYRSAVGIHHVPAYRNPVSEVILSMEEIRDGNPRVRLGRVFVDVEGKTLLYERVFPAEKLSGKLLKLLGNGERPPTAYELVQYSVATGEASQFHQGVVSGGAQDFVWAASPTGAQLVVGQPEKGGGLHFRVVDVLDESYVDFDMMVDGVVAVWVNDAGSVLMNIHYEGEEYLIIRTVDGEAHKVTPPSGYRVLCFGPDFVAVQTAPTPFLMVKTFQDSLRAHADVRSLQRLGLEFEFFFNRRGSIDLVTLREGLLQVTHSDVSNLATDALRWENLARVEESAGEVRAAEEAQQRREEEEKREKYERKKLELGASLATAPVERQPARAARPVEEIRQEFERRRMEFVAGTIDRSRWQEIQSELQIELQQALLAAPGATRASPFPAPALEVRRQETPSTEDLDVRERLKEVRSLTLEWTTDIKPGAKQSAQEKERVKLERLLESLDERLLVGELSEETYKQLRQKYLDRLEQIQ